MDNNHPNPGAQSHRPPAIGSMGSQNFGPPYPMQFRPVPGGQPGQPFMQATSATQQFRPVGQGMPVGQSQPPQFSQPMQQFPSRPGHLTSSQPMSMQYMQPNMGFTSGSQQFQNATPPNNHPGLGGPGVPLSSSYTFATSYGQPQNTTNVSSQFQPISQMHAPVVPQGGQPWLPPGSQGAAVITHVQQIGQQSPATAASIQTMNATTNTNQESSSDWQEFKADGERRYYYNKRTKQSCWDKPLELMTPMEMSWKTEGK